MYFFTNVVVNLLLVVVLSLLLRMIICSVSFRIKRRSMNRLSLPGLERKRRKWKVQKLQINCHWVNIIKTCESGEIAEMCGFISLYLPYYFKILIAYALSVITYDCIGLSRYIAITNLSIIAVFVEYLRQFLIDLNQIHRHSSVPKDTSPWIFWTS